MSDTPSYPPPLVLFEDYSGDWDAYLEAIYELFRQDFVTSIPIYPDRRWALKRHPLVKGKEATFWHIITEKGTIEDERLPDLRRCEHIRWPRWMLNAVGSNEIRVWRTRRGTEERVLLSLPDFSYLVVLTDRKDYIFLLTAYLVEHSHRRRSLQNDYENAVRNGLATP